MQRTTAAGKILALVPIVAVSSRMGRDRDAIDSLWRRAIVAVTIGATDRAIGYLRSARAIALRWGGDGAAEDRAILIIIRGGKAA